MAQGIPQTSFTAGELAPAMFGRSDLNRYYSGARKILNFIVRPYGGVSNRTGTVYAGDLVAQSRLIPFQFSTVQTYVLAFSQYAMRVFTNGAQVVYPVGHPQAGQPVVITTLYPYSALGKLKFTQNADVMTLCHPDYPPQQLSRYDHHDWRFAAFDNVEGPFLDLNVDKTRTCYISNVTGSITITASANIFTLGHVGRMIRLEQNPDDWTPRWEVGKTVVAGAVVCAGGNFYRACSAGTTGTVRPDHTEGSATDGVAGVVWQYLHSGFGLALITAYTDAKTVTATVLQRFPDSLVGGSGFAVTGWSWTAGHGDYYRVSCTEVFTVGEVVSISGNSDHGIAGVYVVMSSVLDGVQLFGIERRSEQGYFSESFGAGQVTVKRGSGAYSYKWAFEAWGGEQAYPGATTYFQQRQAFAATTGKPQTTWFSRTKGYLDFGSTLPVVDDDSISFTVASREVQEIRHMIELSELILLTSSGAWVMKGTQDGVLTPSAVNSKRQGANGCAHVPPVVIGSNVLFVAAKGAQLRSLGYNFQQDAFIGNDLTVLSYHLFKNRTIVDMAFQELPYSCVWAVRSDGTLLGFTYLPDQDVAGWHQHITDGAFSSVCCISEGGEDALYLAVERVVNGTTKHYLERMATRNFTSVEYGVFLDCSLSYIGTSQPLLTILESSLARDVILNYTKSRVTTSGGATIRFTAYYDYAYVGAVVGAVTGVSDFTIYRVDLYSTTDIDYLQGSAELDSLGHFTYSSMAAGVKTAKLIEKATGNVVALIYEGSGLVRSYQVPETDASYPWLVDRCFLYDQAVAVIMAACLNDVATAQYLMAGLLRAIDVNGGVVCFSVNHKTGLAPDVYVRNGATAWVLYALAFFSSKFPASFLKATVDSHIDTVAAQLLSYQVMEPGLQQYAIRGGRGKYSLPDYLTYDPDYLLGWCSTEHNIDSYFALELAYEVRGNASYLTAANRIKDALLTNFWSSTNHRFCQGISNQTTKDYSDALDCHSWGYLFLRYIGANATMQTQCYDGMAAFATTDKGVQGYRPYIPTAGYPDAGTGVWGEGTLGVALARFARGDVSAGVTDFNRLVQEVGAYGLKYSTLRDYVYELSDWYSVASTAWMILAAKPSGFFGVGGDFSAAITPTGAVTNTPASTISGLGHLEGKTVGILADGQVHPPLVVSGGSVQLYSPASVVHIGLPYVSELETLDLANAQSNVRTQQKLTNHVSLLVDESKDVMAGPDADHLMQYVEDTDIDRPETDLVAISIPATWSKTGRILVRQEKPLPLTVSAVIPEVSTGGV